MSIKLLLKILALAVALLQGQHGESDDLNLTEILVDLMNKVALAYRQHTGEVLDPSLIKLEPLQ
jgi:hypothetical protein